VSAAGASDPLRARLTAQLLAGEPARDPVSVAGRLLAIQAQDPRGARLAIRARTEGVSGADVDRELTETRSLVVTWLNRGTLHLVRSEDYPWLNALVTPPLRTANARRLAQAGVSPDAAERGVSTIRRALADEGPLTRRQLGERVRAAGVRTEGQALVHQLILACLLGHTVRGPIVGNQHAYALVADWLPDAAKVARGRAKEPAREPALAELARRFLAGHGPAADRDLAKWAGLPLRDARAGLQAIAGELAQRPDGLVELPGAGPPAALPAPRLLGSFEPLLLGWVSRAPVLGEHAARVVTGGLFRPFALVRGRGAAVWRIDGGEVRIDAYAPLSPRARAALERDGRRALEFLGLGAG
jgi:Winged helix DNA-binding domain